MPKIENPTKKSVGEIAFEEGQQLLSLSIRDRLLKLTREQKHVWRAACEAFRGNKHQPITVLDVSVAAGKSKSTCHLHLMRLLGAGLIDWNRAQARSIIPLAADPAQEIESTRLLSKWVEESAGVDALADLRAETSAHLRGLTCS